MAGTDGLPPAGEPDGNDVVYGVYNDTGLVAWYARSGDDIWKCVTGTVHEQNGYKRKYVHEDEFKEWIKVRAHRLRINALSGKYKYDD